MPFNAYERVAFFTDTSGQGSVNVGEAISDRFFTPDEEEVPNETSNIPYTILSGLDVEVGFGTYNTGSPPTFDRDEVVRSKINGVAGTTKINLDGSGTESVYFVPSAAAFNLILDFINAETTVGQALRTAEDAATAFGNIKQAATTSATGVVEHATVAETRASTSGNLALIASLLEDAAAYVTLTDAATVAVDWSAFINAQVTLTANRTLGNPSNAVPGQTRAILVKGDSGTTRTLSFGANYEGDLPTVEVTTAEWVELQIKCITTTHFFVVGVTALTA